MDNKFEDTRNSVREITSLFSKKGVTTSYQDKEFEGIVLQVLNFKSQENYEFFIYTFDIIVDNSFKNVEEYTDFVSRYSNRDMKKVDKGVSLYFSLSEEGRNDTIKFVFGVYDQYLKMVKSYQDILIKSNLNDVSGRITDPKKALDEVKFDIFLSHRYYLKFYNIIVFYILTAHYGLTVYVDWIFDYSIDRKTLSESTVQLLKIRMNQSKKLLFFNILSSATTNWMAWEVGYFSHLRESSIGILDLDGYCTGNKNVEVLSSNETLIYDKAKGIIAESNRKTVTEWSKS